VQRSLAQGRSSTERALAALQLICASRRVKDGQLYLREPQSQSLTLVASQGEVPELEDLSAIEAFLEQAVAHEQQLENMSTESGEPVRSTIRAGATDLELLPLCAVVEGHARFAGVVALAVADVAVNTTRERQLLAEVAAQLIANDSTPAG
jgi:hypothetical protein